MANANPNRAMAQKALQDAEAAVKAAEVALQGDSPGTVAAPVAPAAPAPKAAQAVHQKPTKAKRTIGSSADASNLKSTVGSQVSAALSVVAQYVNAVKGNSDVAKQKYNELIAAINATVK